MKYELHQGIIITIDHLEVLLKSLKIKIFRTYCKCREGKVLSLNKVHGCCSWILQVLLYGIREYPEEGQNSQYYAQLPSENPYLNYSHPQNIYNIQTYPP